MQLFYDPDIRPGPHDLRPEEAQHAIRVLRKRTGDLLHIIDGRGRRYEAVIETMGKRDVRLTATLVEEQPNRAAHRTTLLVAPTKNIDRLEWVLEKTTEIGVDRIIPILTEHSERKRIRTDRLERVLESAAKQSLKNWLPELDELTPFEEAITQVSGESAQKFLAYLGADQTPLLQNNYRPGTSVVLAIGPEGGFSPAEAALASARGFAFASLGPHRLRTETAAITAVHTVESLNWT